MISLSSCLWCTGLAWSDDAALEEFNLLFGSEIRRVQVTETAEDDLELAQTLLRASEQSATSAPMQLILRRNAAALASSHAAGQNVIAQALAPLSPADRITVLNAVTDQVQLRYTRARGDDRTQAGVSLMQWMHEQAAANAATRNFDEATMIYRRAAAVATAIRSTE